MSFNQENLRLIAFATRINLDESKERILSKPILRLPDCSKPSVLRTDASDVGLGAVLMQDFEGRLFPVCCASRKLLP